MFLKTGTGNKEGVAKLVTVKGDYELSPLWNGTSLLGALVIISHKDNPPSFLHIPLDNTTIKDQGDFHGKIARANSKRANGPQCRYSTVVRGQLLTVNTRDISRRLILNNDIPPSIFFENELYECIL